MSSRYKHNPVKRIEIKAVFRDGQFVNIYSPDREGWNLRLRFGWWLQTVGNFLMFGNTGWRTYINCKMEVHPHECQE